MKALFFSSFLLLLPLFQLLGETPLAELHTEFSKLRNNDLSFTKESSWLSLDKRLREKIKQDKGSKDKLRALYDAALVSERIGIYNDDSGSLERSLEFVNEVIDHAPKSIVDDAMLLKGDLLLRLDEIDSARAVYKDILKGNARSYIKRVTKSRLDGLDRKLFPDFLPSPFLQPPVSISQKKKGKKRIVLDAGHGGDDTGACNAIACEKDLVLDITKRLRDELLKTDTLLVKITREDDYFVPLALRTDRANSYKADLFVSLHINSTGKGDLRGLETYYLDTTNDEASRRLAERESATLSDSDINTDISFIVSDLVQTGKVESSVPLAHTLHTRLVKDLKSNGRDILNLGVKRAPFFVLMGVKAPCVLNELLFIDNPSDAKMLNDSNFRQSIARALASGIREFLSGRSERAPERDSIAVVRSKISEPKKKVKTKKKK